MSHLIRALGMEKVLMMKRLVRVAALSALLATTALAGVSSGASARSRSDEGHAEKGHRHGHGHTGQYFCPAMVLLTKTGSTVTVTLNGFAPGAKVTVTNEKHKAVPFTGSSIDTSSLKGEYEVQATGSSSCRPGRKVHADAEFKVGKKK